MEEIIDSTFILSIKTRDEAEKYKEMIKYWFKIKKAISSRKNMPERHRELHRVKLHLIKLGCDLNEYDA